MLLAKYDEGSVFPFERAARKKKRKRKNMEEKSEDGDDITMKTRNSAQKFMTGMRRSDRRRAKRMAVAAVKQETVQTLILIKDRKERVQMTANLCSYALITWLCSTLYQRSQIPVLFEQMWQRHHLKKTQRDRLSRKMVESIHKLKFSICDMIEAHIQEWQGLVHSEKIDRKLLLIGKNYLPFEVVFMFGTSIRQPLEIYVCALQSQEKSTRLRRKISCILCNLCYLLYIECTLIFGYIRRGNIEW